MATKRKCEKCKAAMAVVLVNKDSGTVDWWFCEKCYGEVMGESALSNVRWRRQGIPETQLPPVPFISTSAKPRYVTTRTWLDMVRRLGAERWAKGVIASDNN